MSNSALSPAAPIGEGNPLQIKPAWCARAGGSLAGCCNHPLSWSSQMFLYHLISYWKAKLVDWGLCIHFRFVQHIVCCCHVIGSTLLKTTFCAHCSFYFFTASYGSEKTTADRVVSSCSIMVHHGF